jgi:hypothetical protein
VKGHRRVLGTLGANVGDSEYQFLRWFDMIGVQRHIKVLGIFCRLWYRDGKSGYLGDLPLVFEYVRDACRRYPELVEFERWLASRVAPLFGPALVREQARAVAVAAAKAARQERAAKKRAATQARRAAKPKRATQRKRVVTRRRAVKKKPKRALQNKRAVAKRATSKRATAKRRAVPKRKVVRKATRVKRRATPAAKRRKSRRHK